MRSHKPDLERRDGLWTTSDSLRSDDRLVRDEQTQIDVAAFVHSSDPRGLSRMIAKTVIEAAAYGASASKLLMNGSVS